MKLENYNWLSGDRVQTMFSDRNLVDALAYAMENNIPPEDVLEAFQTSEHSGFWNNILFWGSWNYSIQQLREGRPVSEVLRARSAPYYLSSAAAYAEKNGTLTKVLPVLARNLQLQRFFAGSAISLIFRNLVLWLAMFLFLALLFWIIFPNMIRLFEDLLEGQPIYIGNTNFLWASLPNLLWLPALLIIFIISFVVTMNIRMLEFLYLPLPYFGNAVRRRILYDLSGMFYCLLASGMDISQAASAAAASEPRWWLRVRLRKFARRVENGEDWLGAWRREIRLETPVSQWILQSGHLTGKLAESFNSLQDILLEDNLGANFRMNTIFAIVVLFANALIIGLFGYAFFYNLAYIIERV